MGHDFVNCLIVVAPDGGLGATLVRADQCLLPLAGKCRRGELQLAAGEGVILLNCEHPDLRKWA